MRCRSAVHLAAFMAGRAERLASAVRRPRPREDRGTGRIKIASESLGWAPGHARPALRGADRAVLRVDSEAAP